MVISANVEQDTQVFIVIMTLMTAAQAIRVGMVEHVQTDSMDTSAPAGQSLLDSNVKGQLTSAKVTPVIITEPVFRGWEHFPASVHWDSLDRNVRQRLMNANRSLALMVQHAWTVSMVTLAPVLWAIQEGLVKQELITVPTICVRMGEHVQMGLLKQHVFVHQDSEEHIVRSTSMNASQTRVEMEAHVLIKSISFTVLAPREPGVTCVST